MLSVGWPFSSYWKTEGALGLLVFKKFYVVSPFVFCRMPLSNSTSSNRAPPIQPLMNNSSCALNVGNIGPPPSQYLPIFVNSCITYTLKPITVSNLPPSIPESIDINDPKFANDPRIQKRCIGQTGPAMSCGFVEANFYSGNTSEPSFVQIKREFTDPGIPDDPRLQNHCIGETKTNPGVLFTQIKQEFVQEKSSSVTSLTDRNGYESCKSENESRDTSTALPSRTTNCTDKIKNKFGYANGTNSTHVSNKKFMQKKPATKKKTTRCRLPSRMFLTTCLPRHLVFRLGIPCCLVSCKHRAGHLRIDRSGPNRRQAFNIMLNRYDAIV